MRSCPSPVIAARVAFGTIGHFPSKTLKSGAVSCLPCPWTIPLFLHNTVLHYITL